MTQPTPLEVAEHIAISSNLLFNPFESGTDEHRQCANELLDLTTNMDDENE